MTIKLRLVCSSVCLSLVLFSGMEGQAVSLSMPGSGFSEAGDTLNDPPPLAKLSPAFTPKAIEIAMRKVGDWELDRSRPYFDQDWTFAALYIGYMAAAKKMPSNSYKGAMVEMGNKFGWKLGPRITHPEEQANDQAIAQVYLDLYREFHDARMLAPTQSQFDALMKIEDTPDKPVWWWCDSLFMAPPAWARLYRATGDISYLNYMDREWWITSNLLYDPQEHLFSRDTRYLKQYEKNGKKIFWSRGNGWVIAGLTRVLENMPENYPTREKYVKQFREMALRIKSIQGADGLWHAGLLDADAYPLPEVSGSAFFVYSLAWGIHHGFLDRTTYLPVVERGWKGLLAHIYVDGRLGCIQPIGGSPDTFKPSSSYVYGVGAFLLAGSEVHALAEERVTKK
jgi:unsaturated rhamnogalacturonyl hydrolase